MPFGLRGACAADLTRPVPPSCLRCLRPFGPRRAGRPSERNARRVSCAELGRAGQSGGRYGGRSGAQGAPFVQGWCGLSSRSEDSGARGLPAATEAVTGTAIFTALCSGGAILSFGSPGLSATMCERGRSRRTARVRAQPSRHAAAESPRCRCVVGTACLPLLRCGAQVAGRSGTGGGHAVANSDADVDVNDQVDAKVGRASCEQ